ncbi:DUF3794 domain-containing protein [Clostridiales bacterium]|nr:DUF3794 domain-containing protein [Clostridiales bacterium]
MTYEEKIPEFALQPAKSASEDPKDAETPDAQMIDDGFDPTPYDRLLVPTEPGTESITTSESGAEEESSTEKPKMRDFSKQEEQLEKAAETAENKEETEDPRQSGSEKTAEERSVPASAPAGSETIQPVVLEQEETESKPAAPVSDTVKMVPLENTAVYHDLKMKTALQKLETTVLVEEDILVPDVKPDLINILSMEGKAILSSKELQVGQNDDGSVRVTGEVSLQTIYLPETSGEEAISIIQSRLPFKTDWQAGASPMSSLSIGAKVETIEYSIINERKFRAKATVALTLTEYAEKEMQLFDSIRGEDLQLLKETIKMSHVALRKEDSVDISEELKLKEGSLKPVKILKSDIRVVENHKQITSEKMVINANIMVNTLYIGQEEKEGETVSRPAFFQGKTDFTQFILMDKEENIAMSKTLFNQEDLEVKINESEDGFSLKGSVKTSVEVLSNLEKEVVTDLYHNAKDTTYDSAESKVEAVMGTGTTEASAREIFNVPEADGQADRIVYINGTIQEASSTVERGRVMVEGVLEGQIICLPESEDKKAFAIKQEIPFRGAMEVPAALESMKAESRVEIKDLWFDKINGKQVEVNASLQIESAVIEEKSLKLIKNPCFVESSQTKRPSSMVIYITRKDDSLWKIAKRYKVSMDAIKEVNQMEEGAALREGTRLLIVK